jgi:S-ribosylhomocysteine lyase LuxS involved in autoinducer biosynthesis
MEGNTTEKSITELFTKALDSIMPHLVDKVSEATVAKIGNAGILNVDAIKKISEEILAQIGSTLGHSTKART